MALNFDKRPALIAYLTCGDPDLATTREVALAAVDAGAQVIELGVPFSDPVADGPVIQRASERALANGVTLAGVIGLGRELRKLRPNAGLIIFSHLNPVLRFGLARFCAAASDAGLDGALITDLTVDEANEYVACMRSRGLATVFLAAPTSTDQRLRRIAQACSGFVYAVSRTGVTGARQELASDAEHLVSRLRHYTTLPVAVGFGISSPEQFRAVGRFADAGVVGSAIVQTIETAGEAKAAEAVGSFIRDLVGKKAISTQQSALRQ